MEHLHVMQLTMRKVLSDFAFWLHRYLAGKTDNQICTSYVLERLLIIPDDIAAVFANYIPEQTAIEISSRAAAHIDLATALHNAQKNADSIKIDEYIQKLYAHAAETADFFENLNPNYFQAEFRPLLDMHVDLIRALISSRLCGEYKKEIVIFDALHHNILNLADFLVQGFVVD